MKEQIIKAFNNIKEYWNNIPNNKKKLFGIIGGGVILVAIAAAVFLNYSKSGYKVLYPGISNSESTQVFATLQEMSVKPQINSNGEVMVPKEQWDKLLFELAGKGFPKTAPAYGIFLDNTGLTTTEFEKKQILLFQLQDRMQETLRQIDGIESATVTIDIPQESNYVWEKSKAEGSAGVLVTMKSGYTLSPERVSAIKNLVASSVPQMKPEDVKVIDAATGVEMESITNANGANNNNFDFKRLEYERQIEKSMEDNIKRLLAPRYGVDGVTAVAKVILDYDKTVSESKELVPQDNGNGVKTHDEEKYNLSGEVPAKQIVGEENNTDVPEYKNETENGDGKTTSYEKSSDYDISYIKTQVEKGQAVLKEASIAVVVNDNEFDTERKDLLVDLISKGVNVKPECVSVTNLEVSQKNDSVPTFAQQIAANKVLLIAIAGGICLLIIIIMILSLISKSKKKKLAEEEEHLEEKQEEDKLLKLQKEIEDHKKMLAENAESNSKENAITNEIRNFAKENPEITASLIRSMLKEDE